MAVLVILAVAGIGLVHGAGAQSRKAAIDLLAGMIDQARAAAITSRSYVVLAVAEPGDIPAGDERCRLGLLAVETWPDSPKDTLRGVLLGRWQTLNTGITLLGGAVDGVDNPMDRPRLTIATDTAQHREFTVHALVFNPHGALLYPPGSTPVAMRVAEGCYRGGQATPYRRGDSAGITASCLKIARLTSHSYHIDG